ncbi:helix-turn-helix transcriptional regulator [Lactococcus garvieae]|uniref:helix-turn-helix domain-containing protein n=1 Tax=Lactococcus garvieae TaxID=1363 RepID=UPI003244908B
MLDKLDALLEERGLTYYQLHKMTGISTSVFSNLRRTERKYLSFENMIKIAEALNISLDVFREKK